MVHPFMRQISVTYRCAMLYRDRQLAGTGLSGCQTPYLTALYREPGLTQEELAQRLNVNKSNVARQLAALEEKGYVCRLASPEDKRRTLVYPTDKAEAIRETIYRIYRSWNELLTADFTDEERLALSDMMQRITARAEAYVKGVDATCAPSDNT